MAFVEPSFRCSVPSSTFYSSLSRTRIASKKLSFSTAATTKLGVSSSSSVNGAPASTATTTPATTTTSTNNNNNKRSRKRRLATGMAFLTGWADVTLFYKFRTFATMMTGNTMWMALAAIELRYKDLAFYASVILSYLMGVALFRKTDLEHPSKNALNYYAATVFALFTASDYIYSFMGGAKWIPVVLLAMGFGIINSVGIEVAGTLTFVITGHMTRLTNMLIGQSTSKPKDSILKRLRTILSSKDRFAFIQNACVVGGFFAGALWACFLLTNYKNFLLHRFGAFSIMGACYGALFLWKDMESFGGAWWLRKKGEMCDLDDDGEICLLEEEDEHVDKK